MCVKFEGTTCKEGRYWPVDVPALNVVTQGRSKKEAYQMIKEAIELYVDQPHFQVEVIPLSGGRFIIRAKSNEDDKYLVALMLKQQRAKYGLSLADIAKRLGITRHAYAQYEQARSLPSLTKVEEFIHAMSKQAHFVVGVFESDKAA